MAAFAHRFGRIVVDSLKPAGRTDWLDGGDPPLGGRVAPRVELPSATGKCTAGLQRFLEDRWGAARGLRVLDAGCGSASHVRIGADPIVTGIDISPEQLA